MLCISFLWLKGEAMKFVRLAGTVVVTIAAMLPVKQATAQVLGGMAGLACEALLCLAAANGVPSACNPALSHYFGITGRNAFSDRMAFLNMCPTASAPNMPSLVSAIVGSAGRCGVEQLNQRLVCYEGGDSCPWPLLVINPRMPNYCVTFYSHPYVRSTSPTYVGEFGNGGRWQ